MACIPLPTLELPALPTPFGISPPQLPELTGDLGLCCKLVPYSYKPAIPLSAAVINPTVIALVNAMRFAVLAYLDALPLSCPRE